MASSSGGFVFHYRFNGFFHVFMLLFKAYATETRLDFGWKYRLMQSKMLIDS